MNKRFRWIVIAAVAGTAAGGVVWAMRHGRATAAGTEAAEPPDPAITAPPAMESGRPEPATEPRRRSAIVMVGILAATVGVTAVAVHIHRPPDAPVADRSLSPGLDTSIQRPAVVLDPYRWAPTPPAWTPSPPAPVPVGGVLPPDGTVIMPGDSGEQMKVTVTRIANPAPPIDPQNPSGRELKPRLGHRLVSITVWVTNTGGVPFLSDIEKHTWLVDKAGRTYPRNVGLTEARQLHPASQLDPESAVGREIVFEVKGSAELTRFRLSTHPGVARQTQDWRLS